jgi:nucleoside transporter
MSDTPEDPSCLAPLAPDMPPEVPLAPIPAIPPAEPGEGAELFSVVGFKLAANQFLHHVCMGSWFVTMGSYVSANSGTEGAAMFGAGFVGVAYSAGPLGGMISPFLTGLMADHWFSAERLTAVLQVLCAGALACAVAASSQAEFFVAIFAYFLFFHPSSSLATSMALHHLRRPMRDFSVVRAWGTAGWVAGGLAVGWIWPWATGHSIESTAIPMQFSIAVSLVTAAFSLTMPHTPPANRAQAADSDDRPFAVQFGELVRDRRFATLMVLAVLAHIPTQFYYAYSNVFFNWAGLGYPAAKMALGQVVEVGAMLLLPTLLARTSVKAAVVLGMAIWSGRYVMLAAGAPPDAIGRGALFYAAILLHGVAFTFATISMQLDVDRCAGKRRRATAQGLFSVAVQGLGCFAGARIAGWAGQVYLPVDPLQGLGGGWAKFWLIPAAGAAAVTLLAAIALRRDGQPNAD